MRHRIILAAALALSGSALPCLASESDEQITEAEKTLKDAGIGTDDAALLKFFKDRIISESDRTKIAASITQLGDDSFEEREKAEDYLSKAGRAALSQLMAAANSRDPEIADRANRCLAKLNSASEAQCTSAAARLLAAHHPADAARVLLDFLPGLEDDYMQEPILAALATLTLKDGKADAVIRDAADSKVTQQRMAAAYVLSRAADDDRKLAVKLLKDAEPAVRFQAAIALVRGGVKDAVPELMRLLTDAPADFAYQSEDLLFRIADDKAPTISLGKADDPSRKKAREGWEAWWKERGEKVDLSKVNLDTAYKGLTLICDFNGAGKFAGGRIWECAKDGKMRWEIGGDLGGPVDAQVLPGGRVLIAEHNVSRVTERDRDGKVLWSQQTNGNTVSCQRLPNGNTLIATLNEIVEVTRDKKPVYKIPGTKGQIWSAYKGKDGKILCAAGNDVVEYDSTGKELRSVQVGGMGGWGGADRMPNGNLLVAKFSQNEVAEVDWTGKVLWKAAANGVTYAQHLPNGNVLVTSLGGKYVAEIDRDGKEVWKQTTAGQPFRTWRY
jgi:hypothetical protein